MDRHTDAQPLKAAAFLIQALGLEDDPGGLAPELVRVERDATGGVYAAELASSVGDAAFLVYVYALAARDPAGRTGRERFDADLATLRTAAERNAPGPRLVAHALTDADGFLLATTPATYRALAGDAPLPGLEAPPTAPHARGDPTATRRAAAEELLRLLRAADAEATAWLAAVAAETSVRADDAAIGEDAAAPDLLSFSPEETELALFLLDEGSIRNLLRALNVFLTAAREQAASAGAETTT